MTPLIEVTDLQVAYPGGAAALRGVSLRLDRGDTLAVIGESGSGKSTLARALAGMLTPPEARGRIALDGVDLLTAAPEQRRLLRWSKVALGLQGAPFNPVVRLDAQLVEPLQVHRGLRAKAALAHARQLAEEVLLDPELLSRYPHELSGGQRQRALLAMTLALDPELIVLDEPTSGLDALHRQQLCLRIAELGRRRGFALIVVTHDLSAAAALAREVQVLYAGRFLEAGPAAAVLTEPAHPYTWALVNASPVLSTSKDLRPIRGLPPDARAIPSGCSFHPRCTQAETICAEPVPDLEPVRGRLVACHLGGLRVLLEARQLTKTFAVTGAGPAGRLAALRGVDLLVREGEAVAVVGPSGSGKSTLARLLAGDLAADSGQVWLQGTPLPRSWGRADRRRRCQLQLVLQNPWDALSPRLSVEQLLREPVDLLAAAGGESNPPEQVSDALAAALRSVGLPNGAAFRRSGTQELSGGQLQRLAVARALLAHPRVLIADEPTAMLDGSEQARLLVLIRDLQAERGMGLVIVSHDLAAVRKVADQIVLLEHGRVVEAGPSHLLADAPRSRLGRELLAATAALDHAAGRQGRRNRAPEEAPDDVGQPVR